MFALTICRPDIAVPVIKLSQHASRPAPQSTTRQSKQCSSTSTRREKTDSYVGANVPARTYPTFRFHRWSPQTKSYENTRMHMTSLLSMEPPTQHGELTDPIDAPSEAWSLHTQVEQSTANVGIFQLSRSAPLKRNLPAWLTLAKPCCASNHSSRTWDSFKIFQPRCKQQQRCHADGNSATAHPSNPTHCHETICHSTMVRRRPHFLCRLPICSSNSRFNHKTKRTHQITRAHGCDHGTKTTKGFTRQPLRVHNQRCFCF
jgi:hypothetical protein